MKLFLDVTKTEDVRRVGEPSGIAVCSTKTVLEARTLVCLTPNPGVGDIFL